VSTNMIRHKASDWCGYLGVGQPASQTSRKTVRLMAIARIKTKTKLRGLSPPVNYTDQATAAM
jgi:hypothetical protein